MCARLPVHSAEILQIEASVRLSFFPLAAFCKRQISLLIADALGSVSAFPVASSNSEFFKTHVSLGF